MHLRSIQQLCDLICFTSLFAEEVWYYINIVDNRYGEGNWRWLLFTWVSNPERNSKQGYPLWTLANPICNGSLWLGTYTAATADLCIHMVRGSVTMGNLQAPCCAKDFVKGVPMMHAGCWLVRCIRRERQAVVATTVTQWLVADICMQHSHPW